METCLIAEILIPYQACFPLHITRIRHKAGGGCFSICVISKIILQLLRAILKMFIEGLLLKVNTIAAVKDTTP